MTRSEEESRSLNLRSLDALRGFLATYVLLGHCRWLLWAGNSEWNQQPHSWWSNILAYASASLRFGHEAVIVFFVLSGFFIHLRISQQLAKSQTFQFNILNFFQRRCYRLVPPYLFALALTVILDLVGRSLYPTLYLGMTGDALLDQNFQRKEFSLISVVPALLLLPSSLGKDFGSNAPLWSLAYEIVYYFLYPFWLRLRQLRALPAYLAGLGLPVLASFFLRDGFTHQVMIHYPIWLCGAALAEILSKRKLPERVILISSLVFVIAFVSIQFPVYLPFLIIFHALLGSSAVLLVVSLPLSLLKNKIHLICEQLGIESYTLYISHFPIITLISAWSIETFKSRPIHGWLAVGGAILTLLLSHICFGICEHHFLHSRLKMK
jgi:peptidoglycan/LPS O-acetylase OafA/YrhL